MISSDSSPLTQALLKAEELFDGSYASTRSLDNYNRGVLHHLLMRGHEGRVLCISASDTVDYIVSGGVDYTMRIWVYDGSQSIYEFEVDGNPCRGRIVKEAEDVDGSQPDSEEQEMTHQLDLEVHLDGGGVERRLLWVRFDGSSLALADGTKAPYKVSCTHEATDSYRLCALLLHDAEQEASVESNDTSDVLAGVTAVACAGMCGPFISGTSNGSLHLMRLPRAGGDIIPMGDLGVGAINDLHVAVADEGSGDSKWVGPWLLAVAGQKGFLRIFEVGSEGVVLWNELFAPLVHDGPVLKVRQVRDAGRWGVRFVSCSSGRVYLWNVQGFCLGQLGLSEVAEVTDLTVTNRHSGTLLFAGSNGHVGVWVIDPAAEALPSDPLAVYRYKGKGIDVDQGADLARYAVHIRENNVIVTWDLLAASPERLIRPESLSKWWELLIRPGKERFIAEMVHHSMVTDFKVVEDDVEGPILLSASSDGTVYTWSMKKQDRGEICAQLRSLSIKELLLPPVLLLTTLVQWCSFAFGPSTKWRGDVKQTVKYGSQFFLFGTQVDMELNIKTRDAFWVELVVVFHIMLLFLICEAVGSHELLATLQRRAQSSESFKEAEMLGTWSFMHLVRRMLGWLQNLNTLAIWLCCTVGVAPMFKVSAQALRCSRAQDGKFYLDVAGGQEVECWMLLDLFPVALRWDSDHAHWSYYVTFLFPLAVVYLLGLAPFAVVAGDASYVQRDELLDVQQWEFNANRKATALNLGMFHPNPRHVFQHLLVELGSKALLPMVTWLVVNPLLQMSLTSALMAALFAEATLRPAFINRTYLTVVQGCRLFALCTMLCGLVTVVVGQSHSWVPVVCLLLSVAAVTGSTTYRILQEGVVDQDIRVMRRSTSAGGGCSAES